MIASTNNVPVHVGDVVDGGPQKGDDVSTTRGVIVGNQPRMGRVLPSKPVLDEHGQPVLDAHGSAPMG